MACIRGSRTPRVGAALAVATGLALASGSAASAADCSGVVGDVTGDGAASVVDVQCGIIYALWDLSGQVGPEPGCSSTPGTDPADMNCDGETSVVDVQLLVAFALDQPLSSQVDANGDGCPDGCEADACGDLVCDGAAGEDCGTCEADCGACPKPAYRLASLALRDPHIFAPSLFCVDLVVGFAGFSVNSELQATIDDPTGNSILFVPDNADPGVATTPLSAWFAACGGTTDCAPDVGATPISSAAMYNLAAGDCFTPVAGSLNTGYTPAPNDPQGPCFFTDSTSIAFDAGGLVLPLSDAVIASSYDGTSPVNGLIEGVIMGFVSQTTAQSVVLPADLPLVGGATLASLLKDGPGGSACSGNDAEMHNGELGWWFYIDFTATPVMLLP